MNLTSSVTEYKIAHMKQNSHRVQEPEHPVCAETKHPRPLLNRNTFSKTILINCRHDKYMHKFQLQSYNHVTRVKGTSLCSAVLHTHLRVSTILLRLIKKEMYTKETPEVAAKSLSISHTRFCC